VGPVHPVSTIANRVGRWSAAGLVGIGAAYAVALVAGFVRHGLHEPIGDPVLAVMEVLTLFSAPAIVMLMSAIHERASVERRVYGLAALAFGTLCAGTTSAVHFVELTAGRQLKDGGIVWPSRMYAAELLAWDVFLGLALVSASRAFDGDGPERAVRRALLTGGILCLAGTVGPAVGNMRLQLVGVVGYAAVLPVVSFLLMRLFARSAAHPGVGT
jgi:hypothetical protein